MWGILLQRSSGVSLARQLYTQLKSKIITGVLTDGEALLSTRELAEKLSISRNTVNEAYEMLAAEGYIICRQGAPTRVAPGVMVGTGPVTKASPTAPHTRAFYRYDFQTGRPDLRLFPREKWLQLLRNAAQDLPLEAYGYGNLQGFQALRQEISGLLYRSRGIVAEAGNIFITAGATHALHIATMLGVFRQGGIAIEDPCHSGMLQVMRNNSVNILPVPVDSGGLQVDLLNHTKCRGIYVTPSHQFPLGGILQADRRANLINHARLKDGFIIEDDYDSEFRYTGEPLSPIYTLDPSRVIYIGTFSKAMFPALRIGYAIVPEQLQPEWRQLRQHMDVQNSPFEQAALSEFLKTRGYDRHVQRMRRVYGNRRGALIYALQGWQRPWHIEGDASGLHLAVAVGGMHFDDAFVKRAAEQSIRVIPAGKHAIATTQHQNKLLLGYGHLTEEEITEGIRLLGELL